MAGERHSHLVCQLVVVKILAALVAPIAVMNDIEMTDMIIIKVFRVFILSISVRSLLESSKTPL
jgi:hypothetical protein